MNKRYGSGDGVSFALRDVGLTLKRGDFFALVGPSGSGKTTLLNLAAGFDFPSEGDVAIAGRETRKMSKS
ncbi:MAG: ATP-binding cassette domain-containing protein, partial [Bdellovibrionota bacterium]